MREQIFRLTFEVIAADADSAHEAVYQRLSHGGDADTIEQAEEDSQFPEKPCDDGSIAK